MRLQLLAGCSRGLAARPPGGREWREALNTDSRFYGGSDVGNGLGLEAEKVPWNEQDYSVEISLPPLGVVWLVPERDPPKAAAS